MPRFTCEAPLYAHRHELGDSRDGLMVVRHKRALCGDILNLRICSVQTSIHPHPSAPLRPPFSHASPSASSAQPRPSRGSASSPVLPVPCQQRVSASASAPASSCLLLPFSSRPRRRRTMPRRCCAPLLKAKTRPSSALAQVWGSPIHLQTWFCETTRFRL